MSNPTPQKNTYLRQQRATFFNRIHQIIHSLLTQVGATGNIDLEQQLLRLKEAAKALEEHTAVSDVGTEDLLALVEIGRVINSTLEHREVLRIVMDTIIRLLNAERGFLMLRDTKGKLSIQIARNWEQESLETPEFKISRTIINRVLASGNAVLTTNASEDPRFEGQESIVAYNLRSILCVPLKLKTEIIGTIYADNRIRTGIFTERERDLMVAFANQAAVAIENARLFASVRASLAEVSELKNLMDNVFASIASGVITTDMHQQIMLCNRAAEAILGYAGANLIGYKLADILPSIAPHLEKHIQTVLNRDQNIVGVDIATTLPHRGTVSLSFKLAPLKDAQQVTQGVAIVLDDLTEKKRLEAERRLFERMVSPKVIEQLDPDKLQLGGERAEITTLFADLRGFTHFSEAHDPEELVTILNRYLAAAAEAVLAHEGTIDKFLGDAVMAWFNAPIPQPDHTYRAVCAALEIKKAIEGLHRQLPPEYHLSFGIGIHYGEAVLGLLGTEERLDYTAIGDSVNTARRIQENAARGQILISAETYQQVEARVRVRAVQDIQAKGKSQPLKVYEVLGLIANRSR